METDDAGTSDAVDTNGVDSKDTNISSNGKLGTIPGVMYISTIPPGVTPLHLQQVFEKYGEVGRIFLQPDEKAYKRRKKLKHTFNRGKYSEGWVEMADKRLAKRIAATMNNTPVLEWKKTKSTDCLWNIKYLHRFRWTHLRERLEYEKAVRQQKMRTELAQARREADAFIANVDASKKYLSIKERKEKKGMKLTENRRVTKFKQRKTVDEMRNERTNKPNDQSKSKSLLSSIFSS